MALRAVLETRYPTNFRALRNSRIQPLYSPAARGRHEFWT
jgi:hypothetical protein